MAGQLATPRTPFRRLLVLLVGLVCDRPRAVLALSLALAVASGVGALTRLEYHTSRNDLISARKDYQQRWSRYLAEFGDDDDIVVVVKGADRERMKEALDAVARQLAARPEHFDRLFYKVDLTPLRGRALMLAPYEQVRTIHDDYLGDLKRLLQLGPLAWHGLGLHNMVHEARSRVADLRPGQPLSPRDERFFAQLERVAQSARPCLESPEAYVSPWGSMTGSEGQNERMLAEPHYFFSGDGELAFLQARPVKEAGSFTAALGSVTAARAVLDEVRREFGDLELGLTGLPVLETDEMVAAERDTRLASWLALAGVAGLFLVVYRGVAYPALTVATLLVGTAWAFGWTTLTVGHLNILSATFAVMLIGMGDYGVLWVMRYEEARRGGMGVREALLHTTTHVAVGNLTAATTLALAFFAGIFADFKAVAELGWIAGCGVLLCALACFTVLPALLMVFDRRVVGLRVFDPSTPPPIPLPQGERGGHAWLGRGGQTCALLAPPLPLGEGAGGGGLRAVTPPPSPLPDRSPSLISGEGERGGHARLCVKPATGPAGAPLSSGGGVDDTWLPALRRRPGLVLAAGVALTLLLGAGAFGARYDHNLLNLQAPELESVRWQTTLAQHTTGASWHALSYRATREEALALAERFRRMPEVSQVIEVASLVPPDQGRKLPLLAEIHRKLQRLPRADRPIPQAPTDVPALRADLARLGEALVPLAGDPLLGRLRESLGGLGRGLEGVAEDRATERVQKFDERLATDLCAGLHKLRAVATPRPIELADLPESLRERFVGRGGAWLVRVFAKDDLWDFGPLEKFTQKVLEVDEEATGKPFTTAAGLRAMKEGLTRAGLYAFGVIVLVLWLDFRGLGRTLLAVLPLVLGVLLSVGLLSLCGVPLNPANMIAFPLILGVGVDNGVHVLHDWLIRRREGRAGVSRAIGRGVLVKALTTMVGFAALMVSTERGLVGLGLILTLGVGCSMLAALVVLPAALELVGRRREAAEVTPAVLERRAA